MCAKVFLQKFKQQEDYYKAFATLWFLQCTRLQQPQPVEGSMYTQVFLKSLKSWKKWLEKFY